LATLAIATLSGFAAVYTERVLKRGGIQQAVSGRDMLAYMQIQMALASLLMIGLFAIGRDIEAVLNYGLWYGFDTAAMVAVVSSALGGLIVSAVLKYADSVLKGYATVISVILTGLLSALIFGTSIDVHFLLAAVTVTCSIMLYNQDTAAAKAELVVPDAAAAKADGKAEAV